jgi:hypothetical protein
MQPQSGTGRMSTKSTQAENTEAQPLSEAKVTPFVSGPKAPQVTLGNQMTDEQLDGVVGGLNITVINKTQSDVLDSVVVFQKPTSGAVHLTVAIAPPPTSEQVLADISTQFGNEFAASVGKTGAVPALEHAVQSAAAKFTANGFDAASAKALAWSSAYDQMSKSGGHTFDAYPQAKATIMAHTGDVAKGIGLEVGQNGNLGGALHKATDLLAAANATLKGPQLEAALKSSTSALQEGLQLAANTRVGKVVMGAINDPASIDAWKNLVSELAVSSQAPSELLPITILAALVEHGALAKIFGSGADSPEVRLVANAVSSTINGLQDACVAAYKEGYINTFQASGEMLLHSVRNVADLGKAMVSGDTGAMKAAVIALGTELVNDYKGMLKHYFVDIPTAFVKSVSSVVANTLDKLGATPYVNEAAAITVNALKDFGEMAKGGSLHAVEAVGDFARAGVKGAAALSEDLARQGVKGAMDAMSSLAADGKVAVSTIENLARAGVNGAAAAMEDLAKKGVNGAVGGIETLVKDGKMAVGTLENLAKQGVTQAVGSIENLAKQGVNGAANAIESLSKAGVKGAIDSAENLVKSGKMAMSTLEHLATSGASGALGAIDHLARVGSADAIKALGNLAAGGMAAAAVPLAELTKLGVASAAVLAEVKRVMSTAPAAVINSLVTEASRYAKTVQSCANILAIGIEKGQAVALRAASELAKTAVGAAQTVLVNGVSWAAKSGGALAQSAVNELGTLARQGGALGQTAANELGKVAHQGGAIAQKAVSVLGDAVKSGSSAAVSALKEVARGTGDIANKAVHTLEDGAKAGFNEAKTAVVDLANSGVAEAQSIVRGASNFFTGAGDWIKGSKMNPSNW